MIITSSAVLWPLNIWGAARRSAKAMATPLASTGTQQRDTTEPPLRVSLSTPTDCVAPLDKEAAIASEVRLAVNVDKLTEPAIIILKEH